MFAGLIASELIETTFPKEKRILITGATGFVGSCFARSLADGTRPIGILTRGESNLWRIQDIVDRTQVIRADLRDYSAVREGVKDFAPDVVYHFATFGGMRHELDEGKIVETNVLACANLLAALADRDYSAFINVGSSSEYGPKAQPMSENDKPEPTSGYGKSKLLATFMCQADAATRGRPNVTLRLFSPYGRYEDGRRLVPSVILSCLKGLAPELSSPASVRDFVYIDDVIEALGLAAARIDSVKGEIINIGSGQQTSVEEIASRVIGITDCACEARWKSRERGQDEPAAWSANIEKAERLLSWRPRHDIESGLRKTIEWFRREGGRLYNHGG